MVRAAFDAARFAKDIMGLGLQRWLVDFMLLEKSARDTWLRAAVKTASMFPGSAKWSGAGVGEGGLLCHFGRY
jgi:hypothetical protein